MLLYPGKTAVQEGYTVPVRILGTGAAHPTKQEGEGVVVTRTGAGVFAITFAESPFQFVGAFAQFLSTTMTDVKNWSCIFGDYNATTRVLPFSLFTGGGVATELAATQRLCIWLCYARSGN